MKKLITLILVFTTLLSNAQLQTFHDFSAETIHGNILDLSFFHGKKVLVVNTASYCGYTPQYTQLEALYQQYQDAGFEIVGFPCNDFGGQEPGSDSSISELCEEYDVTFAMMSRVNIISADTEAVYRWLQREDLNGVEDATVTWNFNKFLIDEAGHYVKHFVSTVLPTDTAITNWIESPSVLIPTGLNSGTDKPLMSCVSPNPASGTIRLHVNKPSSGATLSLYSLDGKAQRIFKHGILSEGMELSCSLDGLSSGLYILRIEGNGIAESFKCFVE